MHLVKTDVRKVTSSESELRSVYLFCGYGPARSASLSPQSAPLSEEARNAASVMADHCLRDVAFSYCAASLDRASADMAQLIRPDCIPCRPSVLGYGDEEERHIILNNRPDKAQLLERGGKSFWGYIGSVLQGLRPGENALLISYVQLVQAALVEGLGKGIGGGLELKPGYFVVLTFPDYGFLNPVLGLHRPPNWH